MHQRRKMALHEMKGDLNTYFNWSANVVMPVNPGAADVFLKENRTPIFKVAQKLLKQVGYVPGTIYRGIILRQPVNSIMPDHRLEYLSFSTQRAVAEHFADVNGFGSEFINVAAQLGDYGYVIEYTPKITEVLFHHHLFSVLPYAEAFTLLRMDGPSEVESLKQQKEVILLQPAEPFTNITRKLPSER